MGAIQKKWKSRRGASILIALVFFLLCLMVGAVILTAATASAGQLRTQRQAQQDYLAVSSAARLLQDLLSEKNFSMTSEDGDLTLGPTCAPAGAALSSTVEAAAEETFYGRKPHPVSLTVDAGDILQNGSGLVEAELSMDEKCNLTVTLAIQEDGGTRVPLVLSMPALVSDQTRIRHETWVDADGNERERSVRVRTYRVAWEAGTITRGEEP